MNAEQMKKLQALNALKVDDFSCSGIECKYVLTETTAENIKVLLDAGFTAKQIDEAIEEDKTTIDLSLLAFQYADASWWSALNGFAYEAGEDGPDDA